MFPLALVSFPGQRVRLAPSGPLCMSQEARPSCDSWPSCDGCVAAAGREQLRIVPLPKRPLGAAAPVHMQSSGRGTAGRIWKEGG